MVPESQRSVSTINARRWRCLQRNPPRQHDLHEPNGRSQNTGHKTRCEPQLQKPKPPSIVLTGVRVVPAPPVALPTPVPAPPVALSTPVPAPPVALPTPVPAPPVALPPPVPAPPVALPPPVPAPPVALPPPVPAPPVPAPPLVPDPASSKMLASPPIPASSRTEAPPTARSVSSSVAHVSQPAPGPCHVPHAYIPPTKVTVIHRDCMLVIMHLTCLAPPWALGRTHFSCSGFLAGEK